MIEPLSAQQTTQFERDGFLVLRGMVGTQACNAMQLAAQQDLAAAVPPLEYEAELGYPGAPASLEAQGGRTVRRLRNAYGRAPCFGAWACDPRLAVHLQQLLGEEIVLTLAHHNCVMTKHPNYGTATGWHRDIRYWSFTRPDLVCVWLALGDETSSNGGLQFIPGSHRMAILPEQLDRLDFLRPELPENQQLFAQGMPVQLQRGDVVYFHSKLFHAAGRNNTGATKTSVAFAYRGRSNPPLAGSRSAEAGEIAHSEW